MKTVEQQNNYWNSIASDVLWLWIQVGNVIVEVKNKIKNLLFKK